MDNALFKSPGYWLEKFVLPAVAFFFFTQTTFAYLDLYPALRGSSPTPADAWKVIVRNNYAYVANDTEGLTIYSITNPANPVLVGQYVTSEPAIGLALGFAASTNHAYVATGLGGVDIVNISNPGSPQFAGNINDGVVDLQANAVLINPGGQYLFIADDSFGIKIFNITNPTNTDGSFLLGGCWTEGTAYDVIFNPNLQPGQGLYVADGEAGITKVNTVDKTNPFMPEDVDGVNYHNYLPDAGGICTSVAGTVNNAFMACGEAGIQVVNDSFTTPSGQFPTMADAYGLYLLGNVLYVAESDGGMIMLDVSVPSKPARFGGFYTGFGNSAYNVTVSGSNVFVAAGGLQIINTNVLANPSRFNRYYSNSLDIAAAGVTGNLAFVADANLGLQVVNLSQLTPPNFGVLPNTNGFIVAATPTSIGFLSNYVFLAEGLGGLEIVDKSDPTNLVTVSQVAIANGNFGDFSITPNYVYAATGNRGVAVIDITDPESASLVTNLETGGFSGGIVATNNFAFVADGSKGLTVLDVQDPLHPGIISTCFTGGNANDLALSGRYAFIADGGLGLSVVDIVDPVRPNLIATVRIGETASGITIVGNYAYLADGLASLMVFDISNPLNPRRVGGNAAFNAPYEVVYDNNRVYVPAGTDGLMILNPYSAGTVSNALSIITQPQSITRPHGSRAYFGVSVSGASPISYQWRKNGAAIPGATNVIHDFTISSLNLAEQASYDVIVTNNFSSVTSSPAILTVVAGLTNGNLTQTYNGSARPVTVATSPAGLSNSVSYNGSPAAPTNAGSYTVITTSLDTTFTGSVTNTLAVIPFPVTVTLSNLAQVYSGSPRPVSYTSSLPGLPIIIVTYNGSTNPPINAGNYSVATASSDPNYSAHTTGTLVVSKAQANLVLTNLVQAYTGTPRPIGYYTVPAGLLATVKYNASNTAPTAIGNYTVTGTITNANYTGAATNTLSITVPPVKISLTPTGGVFALSFTGLTNYNYVLQKSTNLSSPSVWVNIITNKPAANGLWRYTDTNPPGLRRFYRAYSP